MLNMDKMCPRCLFDFTAEDDSQVYCPDCEEYIAEHPDWELLDMMGGAESAEYIDDTAENGMEADDTEE